MGLLIEGARHRSWELLRLLPGQSELPWVIGGDFNEILSNEEKAGGVPRSDSLIEMFRLALMECSLTDLGFVGQKFTWSNNRSAPDTVRCRLDRVCANSSWSALFPDSYVVHLRYLGSDHVPILFRVSRPRPQLGGTRRRPWLFEAQWMRRSECEEIIREGVECS